MPPSSQPIYDAIVVGAGHNGLTAAAYLARAGLSTLVLERREIVGGCCVTEEIAPGCRVSTTSYIASMLRPEVISDLNLADMACVWFRAIRRFRFPSPMAMSFLVGRSRSRGRRISQIFPPKMRRRLSASTTSLRSLRATCNPSFMEPPPEMDTPACMAGPIYFAWANAFAEFPATKISQLISFLTGSLGEFLDQNYESETIKTMFLANNVYGKHGGPYQPGTAIGLLFHLLSGGEHELQGFYGHVMGGMGAITQALAAAGTETWSGDSHFGVGGTDRLRNGRAHGVVLEDGTEIRGRIVLSNADPKRTFLGCCRRTICRKTSWIAVRGIKMDGPCAKVNFVLAGGAPISRHAVASHAAGAHVLHAGSVSGIRRTLL